MILAKQKDKLSNLLLNLCKRSSVLYWISKREALFLVSTQSSISLNPHKQWPLQRANFLRGESVSSSRNYIVFIQVQKRDYWIWRGVGGGNDNIMWRQGAEKIDFYQEVLLLEDSAISLPALRLGLFFFWCSCLYCVIPASIGIWWRWQQEKTTHCRAGRRVELLCKRKSFTQVSSYWGLCIF